MNAIYRAIIIDDEKLIREGLVTYIDWESLGIEICATCADGINGMQAVLEHHPHIILSDIAMPNLDGIMLLEQVRAHGIASEVIFISSYSNFDYAQKAVKLGAFDYLLKPIEAPVLYEAVQRCLAKLSSGSPAKELLDSELNLDKLLQDVLTTLPQSDPVFLNLVRRCGLPTDKGVVLVLAAHCQTPRLRELVQAAAQSGVVLSTDISTSLAVCCLFLAQGNAGSCARELSALLQAKGLAATAVACPDGVYSAFVEAQARLLALGTVQLATERPPYQGKGLPATVIEALSLELLEDALSAFLTDCYRNGTLRHLVDFMMRCSMLFESSYQQLEQYYGKPLQGCQEQSQCLEQLHRCNNVVDLYVCLSNLLAELFGALRVRAMMSPYTRSALRIVRECYADNLSLKQIAHQLNISNSHLSAVFKEDTGYAFSDYLYQYRMNKAQELIKNGNYKVYEVGAMVGYPDMVQFSKRFKKFFGYSPKQWQRSTLS